MPKKKKSIGSVYYDKRRKNFIAQYYEFDYEKNKKVKRQRSFPTEKEADEYLDCIMCQMENPIYIKQNGIPVIEIMKSNARRKLDSNKISDSQFSRINKTINLISTSIVSHKRVDDLTTEEIQGYLNSLKHYSNSYLKKIFEQFNSAFLYAKNKGYIIINPMCEVYRPRSNKKDKVVRPLNIKEQLDFTNFLMKFDVKDENYKNIYLIQMYMGLRIGEVLALSKNDINRDMNFIRVNKTLTTDGNGKVIMGDTTKTYAGNRILPIPKRIKTCIDEQMKIAENNSNGMLFLSPNGNYVDSRNVNRKLKKILKDNFEITDISTHSLRHTYATRCNEAEMNLGVMKDMIGHTDISTTINTYVDFTNEYKQNEANKLDDYYLQKGFFNEER